MDCIRILVFALSVFSTPAICLAEGTASGSDNNPSTDSVCEKAGVRVVFGGSFSWHCSNFADFKPVSQDDTAVFIENDSGHRATFLIGVLLKLCEKRPVDLLASLEFAEGTQKVLDGFLLGIGYRINRHADLVLGYSRRLGRGLSPGFRREAAHLVKALKLDPRFKDRFSQYEFKSCNKDLKNIKQFDGFPLLDPRTGTRLFSGGDPIVDSFNGAIHLGIVFPISLKGLFGLSEGS